MFEIHRLRDIAFVIVGLLIGAANLQSQEFPEPLPSTTQTDGSLLVPAARDVDPAPPTKTAGVRTRASSQPVPMSAEDLQTFREISRLHEQFVRAQIGDAASKGEISRTDPNRQRLQHLWERVAQIERQLILEVTNSRLDDDDVITTTRAVVDRSVVIKTEPESDLDEQPDPLTATNQGVPDAGADRDQQTARSIVQEDRSPAPDPTAANDVRQTVVVEPDVRSADGAIVVDPDRLNADEVIDTPRLWQEYVELHREILLTEIAAARAVMDADEK